MSGVKSGLKVSAEALQTKEKVSKKELSACRFMLNDKKTEVILEPGSEVPGDCKHPFRQVCKGFKKDNVRFALVNTEILDEDEVGDKKFCLLYWSSDEAKLKEKMTATASVEAVRTAFGLQKHIEMHDNGDIEPDTFIKKISTVGKKVSKFDGRKLKVDKKKCYVYDGHATSSEDEA